MSKEQGFSFAMDNTTSEDSGPSARAGTIPLAWE